MRASVSRIRSLGVLIIFSGLPGTGKTTIARELAQQIGAVYLRVDSIEQALRGKNVAVEAEGYDVAHAVAEDNLHLGRVVVADCVNPWTLTRNAWRAVAARAAAPSIDVEIVCSDVAEHRRRVESRAPDIEGHVLPTWADVVARDYHPWDVGPLQIDTAHVLVDEAVERIRARIRV
jgi:predicted kinase